MPKLPSKEPSRFELPKHAERYLAALSKLYEQEGERELQELLVNSQTRIETGWTYDNWNGGTHGHALFLSLAETIYLRVAKRRDDLQRRICEDLNNLVTTQNESFAEVFLEFELDEAGDWRRQSGLLLTNQRTVAPESSSRIWGDDDSYRMFLSHKSEVKAETAKLKGDLELFGASAFVAHADIHPTREWQEEIENALATADCLVALLTSEFHDSDWTDQEIGYAVARGVPIIPVKLGSDPYGFIGKYQAVSCTWMTAPQEIVKIAIRQERMFGAYVRALRRCPSWNTGNWLATVLPALSNLSAGQIDELVAAYNETSELRGAFGFNGTRPGDYGPGLVSYLNRLGQRAFEYGSSFNDIRLKSRTPALSKAPRPAPRF